ncbi:hypothetical protein LCGC14_0436570 [marine sediment metagenome]|uniref:Uncharacterized protein n=1 Tax=marine sediment metagenome TaxID=412755 RepID=A0A0F9VVU3_9ZZZZ
MNQLRSLVLGVLIALFVLAPSGAYTADFFSPTASGGVTPTRAAYASCVGAIAGDTCYATDGPGLIRIHDGSTFNDLLPGAGFVTPPDASWTTVAGTPNLSIIGGVLDVDPTTTRTLFYKAAPTAPYTITIGVVSSSYNTTNTVAASFQIGFYNVAGDNGVVISRHDDLSRARIIEYTAASTAGGASVSKNGDSWFTVAEGMAGVTWIQLKNDTTNVSFEQLTGPKSGVKQFYTELETGINPDAIMVAFQGGRGQIVHYLVE